MRSWARAVWYPSGNSAYVYLPQFPSQGIYWTDVPCVRVPQGEPGEKALLWYSASGNKWALVWCAWLACLLLGCQGGHTVRRSNSKRKCGDHTFFCRRGPYWRQGYQKIPDRGHNIFNKATILWYSKQQNTVETSTFSSEFIALKTETEFVEALWYKFWMFGIPIEEPTNMFCDN